METLSRLLRHRQKKPEASRMELEKEIQDIQLQFLRVQQGLWHSKGRAIFVFEGFDAAGKGGCIRTLTERLDPRGVAVHPIGPPAPEEQGRHWLYRFWVRLPKPGVIAVFDRSWYGRVLVEKVDKLAPAARIRAAYGEIREFEKLLRADGIQVLKFFLAISQEEQLARFEDRLKDPYKRWKLTDADLRARGSWSQYVRAVDKMLAKTPGWCLVPANHKHAARMRVLQRACSELGHWGDWMEKEAASLGTRTLRQELRKLGKEKRELEV
jgi:polyphosphate kinase 2 (PPK2 family)